MPVGSKKNRKRRRLREGNVKEKEERGKMGKI
jgi:hypothetical protein